MTKAMTVPTIAARAVGAVLALAVGAVVADAASRPNIVWLTCEDMSPRLGCYGDATVATPNADRLASQGVRYERCFSVYGVCAPNRHTLITGAYPTTTGAMAMRTMTRTSMHHLISEPALRDLPTYEATPPSEVRCFPELLRGAGYYCTNDAKTDYQFQAPVTVWDACRRGAHWRDRPTSGTPFFAVFNCEITHESGTFGARSPSVVDPADVPLPPYYPDTPIVRRDVARHYDNIAAMDRWLGERLAEIDDAGLAGETWVFFFSDHGDGLPRHKRWVYDSGLHTPLIIRSPTEDGAGQSEGRLVSFIDLAPSVLSLAHVPIPEAMEGQAFLGAAAEPPRQYVYACRDRMDPATERIRAVRDARFKYVRNHRPDLPYLGDIPYRDRAGVMQEILRLKESGGLASESWQFAAQSKPLEELYDTESDPHELRNLAADPAYLPKLTELRDALAEWTRVHGDLGELSEPELLKRLWPPDGVQPTTAEPIVAASGGRVVISCETPGASIGYQREGDTSWAVYDAPFGVAGDRAKIRVIAHRIGYKPSEVVSASVTGR